MALSSATAGCTTVQISACSLFVPNVISQMDFAETSHLMKSPAEIMKHDPMDIPATSAIPHTINYPPTCTRASFHQQVLLMSGQNESPSHIPSPHLEHLYHSRTVCYLSYCITKSHLQQITVALTVFSVL
jgi:hypothetical protein